MRIVLEPQILIAFLLSSTPQALESCQLKPYWQYHSKNLTLRLNYHVDKVMEVWMHAVEVVTSHFRATDFRELIKFLLNTWLRWKISSIKDCQTVLSRKLHRLKPSMKQNSSKILLLLLMWKNHRKLFPYH